jgi:hypothetical protein
MPRNWWWPSGWSEESQFHDPPLLLITLLFSFDCKNDQNALRRCCSWFVKDFLDKKKLHVHVVQADEIFLNHSLDAVFGTPPL